MRSHPPTELRIECQAPNCRNPIAVTTCQEPAEQRIWMLIILVKNGIIKVKNNRLAGSKYHGFCEMRQEREQFTMNDHPIVICCPHNPGGSQQIPPYSL